LVHRGYVVTFWEESFRTPDGAEMTRDVVRHPGAVSVVPLHDDGTVTLVSQFRAPLNRYSLEIPAGKIDDGENDDLATAALRELREEVGLVPDHVEHLSTYLASPGFCDEVIHVFLATGLNQVETALHGPEEEHMDIVRLPLADLVERIDAGELFDSKTTIGLLAAARRRR
jgi:ADP-ribose pyrophosphatase